VACEPLYSHAVIDQIDFERRSRDCSGSLAAQCFWPFPFRFPYANRILKMSQAANTNLKHKSNSDSEVNRRAVCLKEIL
jgi:hypothetical protein